MIYEFDRLSFQIFNVWRYFHKKGKFSVKPRRFAALSFRVNGTATVEIDGKTFEHKGGEMIYIPADMPYKEKCSDGESIVAHFIDCNYNEAEHILLNNPTEIKILFEKLLLCYKERCSVNKTKAQIYEIFDKLQEDNGSVKTSGTLADCLGFIEKQVYNSELTVATVAEECFTSVSTLQREFNKTFKTSPKKYLNALRMKKAAEMLAENQLSVKEIANICGFEDEKYFSRKFKKHFGCSPKLYRI